PPLCSQCFESCREGSTGDGQMGRIGRNVCDSSSIIRYSNLPVVGISPESFTIHTICSYVLRTTLT
ncbi:Uncharacterized protein APZ42_005799, partial [Daphnia magna]